MQELLKDLLMAVITAAVPVLTVYLVRFIRKVGDNAAANAVSVEAGTYITEIAEAIAAAVAATNQTYVDGRKKAGTFNEDAQKQAVRMALAACLAALSQATKDFIGTTYGDINKYLTTRIEAEVRNQKNEAAALASTR